jgi:hypothetical protein
MVPGGAGLNETLARLLRAASTASVDPTDSVAAVLTARDSQ